MLPLRIRVELGLMATGGSLSDCLLSYPGQTLGESYSTAEMQSIYSDLLKCWSASSKKASSNVSLSKTCTSGLIPLRKAGAPLSS